MFYSDKYTDADLVGLVDPTTQIVNLVTPDLVFDSSSRILVRSHMSVSESTDDSFVGAGAQVDTASTNHMPVFYWRSTFKRLRDHMQQKFNTSTFEAAFHAFGDLPVR